jgi:hypothetical protein
VISASLGHYNSAVDSRVSSKTHWNSGFKSIVGERNTKESQIRVS